MTTNDDRPWLAFRRPQPRPEVRLFCFPFAGGGASLFRTWADRLPAWVEVCPVQLPGREARINEPPFTSVEALVGPLRRGLAPLLDRPFAFFGHSMGAAIAHRLTVHLRDQGGPQPVLLAASGRQAPQLQPLDPPFYDLPGEAFVARLRNLQGTPAEVLAHAELMELLLPALRADFTLNDTYRPPLGEPLAMAVSAFGGEGDAHVSREGLAAWEVTTCGRFRLRMLPGDHFFLRTAPETLLAALQSDLAAALGRGTPAMVVGGAFW